MTATMTMTNSPSADELLLCDESVVLATPRKQPAPTRVVASKTTIALPEESFDVCPWEVIEMRLAREASGNYARNADYLTAVQTHGMEAVWRAKMCRWMFETAQSFKLTQDSVGCAIHFMDQYLSAHSVDKVLLQLLCLVCMYIAAKMHESEPITMEEMELLCENKFTREQILAVESKVLEVLDWKLNPPVAFTFARDLMTLVDQDLCDQEDLEAHVMALVQVTCEDYGSVQHSPSLVGISAVKLVAKAQMLPALDAAVSKTLAQLQLPRRAMADCSAFVRGIYVAQFQPQHDLSELGDAADAAVESTPTPLDPYARIDSPTSVDEYFEPRNRKTSASVQRLIAAVDASESKSQEQDESPRSAKRARRS